MKKIFLSIFVTLFAALNVCAQKQNVSQPATISEAVWQLDEVLTEEQKTIVRSVSEEDFIMGSSSALGKWLQHEWLYVTNKDGARLSSELKKFMLELDVVRDDDMAEVILRTYYRWLHGKELELIEMVADIRDRQKR